MSVQGYIDGWPANIGVACWQGEVLASVCAELVATTSATGPSTVARIIRNGEMEEAARRVVGALGLSGTIGFDFMIEAATGDAYLIEMNPRNTPICAVRLGAGRDLAEALVARIAGRAERERPPRTERDIVVFFPDTWREYLANHFLRSGYHDVPGGGAGAGSRADAARAAESYGILRMLRRLWLKANSGYETPGDCALPGRASSGDCVDEDRWQGGGCCPADRSDADWRSAWTGDDRQHGTLRGVGDAEEAGQRGGRPGPVGCGQAGAQVQRVVDGQHVGGAT